GLSLEPSAEVKNLEYMMAVLAVPVAPRLVPISETYTLEMSLNRIDEGLHLYRHLLQDVKERLQCSENLSPSPGGPQGPV
ncbi:hypothetical protein NFI96_031732, partial [Prochilodus magdalenae]